ncbi:queuosine precursor transporter [Williamwhitmania taraxaci]|uniref:Probable queuosine precursor transporter n=1 Tax=Williamwhitmania taraxaci TaxID=1640674 RepID=A0A1G6H1Z4_9BACT|nr:queuosine precursor transporter [Williamwhitmania taraxaci]SDB88221.1 hypothetical protein SAMN05216323_100616 [Williamwhitmania taraxaci]
MNELLWLLEIVVCFSLVVLAYKLFGKAGLWAWIPISIIIANIQVTKTIEIFGFAATLGNVIYSSSFLVTDLLTERYGKADAKKAVLLGFFTLVVMVSLMNLAMIFAPIATDSHSLGIDKNLKDIFGLMPRIGLASLAAYLVSQWHDVWAFELWKSKYPSRKQLWIRNNLSTLVSQFLDTVIFTMIAFYGTMPMNILLEIVFTTYLLKGLISLADTPFLYLAMKIVPMGEKESKP